VYKDTVLLRIHDKFNKWLSIGGHIELDEDPNQSAIREVHEEVGLNIVLYEEKNRQPIFEATNKSLIPPQYLNRHRITNKHEHITFIYFAKSESNKLKLSDTKITEKCKWFTKEEIINNDHKIPDDIQFYALEALKKLSKR